MYVQTVVSVCVPCIKCAYDSVSPIHGWLKLQSFSIPGCGLVTTVSYAHTLYMYYMYQKHMYAPCNNSCRCVFVWKASKFKSHVVVAPTCRHGCWMTLGHGQFWSVVSGVVDLFPSCWQAFSKCSLKLAKYNNIMILIIVHRCIRWGALFGVLTSLAKKKDYWRSYHVHVISWRVLVFGMDCGWAMGGFLCLAVCQWQTEPSSLSVWERMIKLCQ